MKSVFIFGAGSSKLAGAPLMNNFLDCAYDLLRLKTSGVIEVEKEFVNVFDAIAELQGVHSKSYLDLDNIEILFGTIEMGLLLCRLGDRNKESITNLRSSLITLIYKTLENSIKFPVRNERLFPPKPYDAFISILKDAESKQPPQDPHGFSFITFNYDLCLDFALNYYRYRYDYCLEPTNAPNGLPLLKLHGSINWGSSSDDIIVPFNISDAHFRDLYDYDHVIFNLGSRLSTKYYKEKPLIGPIIVPPTWNKNSYHGQLSNVWSRAAFELSLAENIFVIGYSLPETDSFFRYLYALGSESKTRLRNFIVINPDKSGKTKDRFSELIGRGIESRFEYIELPFQEGIGIIKDILKNP